MKLHTRKAGPEEIDAVELIGELQATLNISAAPAGARIFLGDAPLGAIAADGSFSATVPTGSHRVRLTAEGYQDWAQEVSFDDDSKLNLEARMSPKTTQLTIFTQPGQVQVYLDDEPRGITSSEGRLVLKDLVPRSYHLRLTLIGYKEWTTILDLGAGASGSVEARLETAGPKPLALSEIEEALANGVSAKRVAALVKEFGVDFVLSDEVEQRLRRSGADDALLLAIARGKK